MSLHQGPNRTTEEQDSFEKALNVMATLYASPLSTVVLQLKFLPSAPPATDSDLQLNTRPYKERGWTTFEDLVTREVIAWLSKFPDVQEMLNMERDGSHTFPLETFCSLVQKGLLKRSTPVNSKGL